MWKDEKTLGVAGEPIQRFRYACIQSALAEIGTKRRRDRECMKWRVKKKRNVRRYVRKNDKSYVRKNCKKYVRKDVKNTIKRYTKKNIQKICPKKHKNMRNNMPERMSKVMPEDLSDRRSKDMSERISKDMSERMSEDMSERISKDMSERMSKDMSERMLDLSAPTKVSKLKQHELSYDGFACLHCSATSATTPTTDSSNCYLTILLSTSCFLCRPSFQQRLVGPCGIPCKAQRTGRS